MKPMFLFLALAVAANAFACGDGDESISGPPGQVAVEELSLEEVRAAALAALSRLGQVYHSTQTVEGRDYTFTSEVWLDLERDVARVEEGEHRLRIFHEEKIAELGPRGRFQDAAIWHEPGLDKTSALSLGYIATLFARDIESTQLSAAEVEGIPAVLVEVVRPYRGDYTGTATTKLYLDEAFLPLSVDYHADLRGAPDRDWSMVLENEFVDPDSLPEGFFSPEAVRALEVTPADDIARAAETGLRPYWLGERFEGMALQDAMLYEDDGEPWLVVTYGQDKGLMGPFSVDIFEYTESGWDKRRSARERPPWWEEPGVIKTPVVVLGTEATLYEGPKREGEESNWLVLVHLDDTVLHILPSGGPPGSNPYRDTDALLRLANSIRPFERPSE